MRKIPELLVPAGGMEQLKAAVACGADAVYLGGSHFSARAGAENFSDAELREAIDYAHEYGVSVHVAVNTLMYQEEMAEALDFAAKIYGYGADAMIVQDTGLASAVHRCLPGLPLHLSTQGTVTDIYGVRAAEELGAERAILARELSLDEIRKICREKDGMEIEIFVHGAICIALSGQCHMSGVIGGRSGNRGECAQPCRMMYSIGNADRQDMADGYLLSPADMCLLASLRDISDAGVDSIKIEGRMKSPEYVALTTSIYRKYLDMAGSDEKTDSKEYRTDVMKLRQVYSRGPFTDAYLKGRSDAAMMSGASSKNSGIKTGRMLSFNKKKRHASVKLSDDLSIGDGIEIRDGRCSAGNIVTYIRSRSGELLKKAEAGSIVEVGDLRTERGIPADGSDVFRITDKKLTEETRHLYEKPGQRIPVDFTLYAEEGRPARLDAICDADRGRIHVSRESEKALERAEKHAASKSTLAGRLARTGNTPYLCRTADVVIKGKPFTPASLLNELRRDVLNELTAERLNAGRPSADEAASAEKACRKFVAEGRKNSRGGSADSGRVTPSFQLYFYDNGDTWERIKSFAEYAEENGIKDRFSFCLPSYISGKPVTEYRQLMDVLGNLGIRVNIALPTETRRMKTGLAEMMKMLGNLYREDRIDGVLAANAGQLPLIRDAGIPFACDTQMNVMNNFSGDYWFSEGARSVSITDEPDVSSSFSFDGGSYCVSIYGRIPVMYLEHCPVGCHGDRMWHLSGKGAPACGNGRKYFYCRKSSWQMTDRKGASYPVTADSSVCRATVYSHKKIDRVSEVQAFRRRGADIFRINIFDESPEILKNIVYMCQPL